MFGSVFAVIALVLEVVHFAITKDSGLPFIALVLVTLAILVPVAAPLIASRRTV